MALRVVAVFLAIVVPFFSCGAQDSVKRSIFEDCDKASSEFSKLTLEQQSSLLDFFARVIALNTQSPSAPEIYAMVPATQISGDAKALSVPRSADVVPGALWQSMDAKRELRAKMCALNLLESAGALSLSALPALVATYSEQPLSDEVAVAVEEVAASIAETAHLQGRVLEPPQVEAIVPHTLGQRPLLARNIIHEFRNESLPYLISLIATKRQPVGPELRSYLESIDPDGSLCMRSVLSLIPGLTEEQIRHLTTTLPLPAPASLPPLTKDLIQFAADPAHAATFTPLLGRACVALGGLTVDAAQQDAIASIPSILSPGTLSKGEAECLIQSSAGLAKQLTELLSSADAEQQSYAVELCREGLKGIAADARSGTYSVLRRLALEPSSPAWPTSLHTLTIFSERKSDTVAVAQQLFKTAAKSSDPAQAQRISDAAFELLSNLSLGKDVSRFSGQILESFRSGKPAPGALALAKAAPTLDPQLLSLALTIPPTQSSLVTLEVLAARSDIPQKSVASLIELLRYSNASLSAEHGLLSLGKVSIAPIRKALPRLQQGMPKMSATGVLVQLEVATKAEAYGLTAGLASLSECSYISKRAALLCGLVKHQEGDPETKDLVANLTQRCLPHFEKAQLQRLAECTPDTLFAAGDVVGVALTSGTLTAEQIESLTSLGIREIPSNPSRAGPLLAQLLRRGPTEIQNRILTSLTAPQSVAPEVRDALRDLSADMSGKREITTNLLRALAATADPQYPWREFVKKAIESAQKGHLDKGTADIISVMQVEPVLAEVLPALESDKSESLVGAALVGAALGDKAVPLVSRLWHLRTMRSPPVRYTASLALLEINPLTPDMSDTVKRLLVNRFFDTAVGMPIAWSNTVAVNDLNRGTFGTVRKERLESLLAAREGYGRPTGTFVTSPRPPHSVTP